MSEVRIAAEPRTEFGKGAARRVRRANKVPVVLYGHGESPRHYSLPGHELMLALRHDPNALLTLQTEQGDQLALPKSVVRDPVKGFLEHVDLVAVRQGEKVTVDVPVTVTGEAGGDTLVDVQHTTMTVEAEATNIPESIEVSVEGLAAGDQVHAEDVALPEGVTLAEAGEDVVVQGLAAPSAAEVEADLAAAEDELGAGQGTGVAPSAGSESDAVGRGDVVPETAGPQAGPEASPSEGATSSSDAATS
ncbi:MAG: 50S ribosomal protein L25/general stress protein Ctc [Actinomycetota bacterium]|nr:50S ribosomal protein L25/general stress protein Ctc [Actinomycetota bacterium]